MNTLKHPAVNFVVSLYVRDPAITESQVNKQLMDWGFLSADPTLLPILRGEIQAPPQGFNPGDRLHRPSVRYLRDLQIYEIVHPNDAMNDALEILADPEKRMAVEQILLARLDLKYVCKRMNEKQHWHLTEEALKLYRHYFWNVPSMTFDDWGRYMYNRTSLHERYMGLLTSPPKLAFYHLRIDQTIESKRMIQDLMTIAHKNLLELDQKPGVPVDKVKGINLLGKIMLDAHAALSTSDMALKDVLKQFEQWRMEHPQVLPPALKELAPANNFSGSGAVDPDTLKN